MSILTDVNEIEGKVVDTVRSMQKPVVDYVRKGVDLADGKLPKVRYPENLPKPAEVVSSQFEFAKALLDAQRDFVKEILDVVTPLVSTSAGKASTAGSTARATAATAAAATAEPEAEGPAPKTAAKPAAKRSTARKTTRSTKAGA